MEIQAQRPHAYLALGLAIAAALALAPLSGCKDRDGESLAARPAETAKEPDHAHGEGGAGEGGEEGHADEVKLTTDAVTRYGIKVEPAQLRQLRPTFVVPARVAFNTEAMAHVGSPLKGRAVEIKVRLGDAVQAGDDLVIVESPELGEAQSDFFAKRTAVETSGPSVELARAAWERARGLYEESQGISLTEVQKREAEYKVAVAALKAAQAAAQAAENKLHLLGMKQGEIAALAASGEVAPRFTIHAAIAGQVVEREVTLGELVSPEREALLVIADTTTLWVLADVPEARLGELAKGAKAWVRVGGTEGPRLEGTLSFISPVVDTATRTAQVRIDAAGNDPALKPGVFAQAEIVSTPGGTSGGPEPEPVVAVPDEAVQTIEGGPAVFVPVEGEENTFAKRAVRTGPAVGGLIPIYAGLADGERFVSAGSFLLKADLGKAGASHEH